MRARGNENYANAISENYERSVPNKLQTAVRDVVGEADNRRREEADFGLRARFIFIESGLPSKRLARELMSKRETYDQRRRESNGTAPFSE